MALVEGEFEYLYKKGRFIESKADGMEDTQHWRNQVSIND
jgi:hypothetical protein